MTPIISFLFCANISQFTLCSISLHHACVHSRLWGWGPVTSCPLGQCVSHVGPAGPPLFHSCRPFLQFGFPLELMGSLCRCELLLASLPYPTRQMIQNFLFKIHAFFSDVSQTLNRLSGGNKSATRISRPQKLSCSKVSQRPAGKLSCSRLRRHFGGGGVLNAPSQPRPTPTPVPARPAPRPAPPRRSSQRPRRTARRCRSPRRRPPSSAGTAPAPPCCPPPIPPAAQGGFGTWWSICPWMCQAWGNVWPHT